MASKVKKRGKTTVQEKILKWGEPRGKKSVQTALVALSREGLSHQQIARKFRCSVTAIRNFLINSGKLDPKSGFLEKIKELGYDGPADFFTNPENVRKTFKTLGTELGFCYVTISAHYNKFREEMSQAEE